MLPLNYKVDFSPYQKDLITQALRRMLLQHYDKCVLRQFFAAFIAECQELYDACIDMQRLRTAYEAEGENLNGLGRIVGETRIVASDDMSRWLFFDSPGQGFDQALIWCLHASTVEFIQIDDERYRLNIILKAIKNHNLTSSVPEIQTFVQMALDTWISFQKTGPNQVDIIVPDTITKLNLRLILLSTDDYQVDERRYLSFPVTLNISNVIFAPDGFFIFDTKNRGFDEAFLALVVPYTDDMFSGGM